MPDPAPNTGPKPPPAAPPPPPRPSPLPNLPPMEMVRLANMMHSLAHDPQTRGMIADAMFKKDPQFAAKAFSDVALDRRFNAMREELKRDKLQGQIDDAVRNQKADRKALIDGGRTEEEVADIEKLMNARGYHSYKDAAVLFDAAKPPAVPSYEAKSSTWEFPTVTNRDGSGSVPFKDFQKDSKSAAYNAAYRVIDEFRLRALPPTFRTA